MTLVFGVLQRVLRCVARKDALMLFINCEAPLND